MHTSITKDDIVLLPIAVATVAGNCLTFDRLKEALFYVVMESGVRHRYGYFIPRVGQLGNGILIDPEVPQIINRLSKKGMIDVREVEYRDRIEEVYCATEKGVKRALEVAKKLKNVYGEGEFVSMMVAKASGGRLSAGKLFLSIND